MSEASAYSDLRVASGSSGWQVYLYVRWDESTTSVTISSQVFFRCVGWAYTISNVEGVANIDGNRKAVTANINTYDYSSSSAWTGNISIVEHNDVVITKGSTARTVRVYGKIINSQSGYMTGERVCYVDVEIPAASSTTSYTITYNANGGSGAPSSQTKTAGVALQLSSTVPTRSGYTFLGWSTSSTATTATYSAGGVYSTDASATLYAVWSSSSSTKTQIVSARASRASSSSSSVTATFTWTATTTPTNAKIQYKRSTASSYSTLTSVVPTSTSGTTSGTATMSTSYAWDIKFTLTVSGTSYTTTKKIAVGGTTPVLDFSEGSGVGILLSAPSSGLEIGDNTTIDGTLTMKGNTTEYYNGTTGTLVDWITAETKGAKGYIKLASGILIQWGSVSFTAKNGDGDVTASFSTSFTSSSSYIIVPQLAKSSSYSNFTDMYLIVNTQSTSSATIHYYWNNSTSKAFYVKWIAIGY